MAAAASPSTTNLVYGDLETPSSVPKELSAAFAVSKVPLQRLMCARALSPETDEDPVATAARLSKDAEWQVREGVASSLGNLLVQDEKKNDKIVPLLLLLCRDAKAEVRTNAAISLARFPQKSRIGSWLSLTRDKDPKVRCAGAECLGRTSKDMPEAIVNAFIVPELLSLCREDISFSVRKTGCRSLARLVQDASNPSSPTCAHWRQIAAENAIALATDPAWPCRRAAADAMSIVCGGSAKLDVAIASQLVLLNDQDVSKWVRQAAQKSLGLFLATSKLESCAECLRAYSRLANSHDEESRFACAFYMPGVLLAVPEAAVARWDQFVKEAYDTLANDPSFRIRRSLAHSIHHIGKSIGPALTSKDLLPSYLSFLQDMDEEEEIRLGALRSAVAMLRVLPLADRTQAMEIIEIARVEVSTDPLAALAVSRDSRLALALQLPEFAQITPPLPTLGALFLALAKDEAHLIRKTALDAFGEVLPVLENPVPIIKEFESQASSSHYWSRWAFARGAGSILKNEKAKKMCETLKLAEELKSIAANDPVAAVKAEAEAALKGV